MEKYKNRQYLFLLGILNRNSLVLNMKRKNKKESFYSLFIQWNKILQVQLSFPNVQKLM